MLHNLEIGMAAEKLFALHQGHGVGVDLGKLVDTPAGEGAKDMRNSHLQFAENAEIALAEQFVVLQNAACYSVLDS